MCALILGLSIIMILLLHIFGRFDALLLCIFVSFRSWRASYVHLWALIYIFRQF